VNYVVRQGRRIEVDTDDTIAPARRKRARTKETFARIPHESGMKLYGRIDGAAWIILLELDRLIYKSYGQNPVRLTNQNLAAVGMPRNTKSKALRQLEDAGVITVVQDGQAAALVTHLWHPAKP
jgi:DNA-binding transcriptional ArsR family regulator